MKYVIHEKADMQVECSEDAESSGYMWTQRVLLSTIENQNSLGERKHAQEIWEKFEEDHVVEYVQSNIDGNDSEGTS